VTIFVDGYNLIFAASRRYPEFDTNRPDAARERLLELLAHHKLVTSDRIVVFFDGGPEAAHLPRRQMVRGLDVFFSEANSDADTDIKNAVSHDGNPTIIRVVTSDTGIQSFVQKYGVSVTDSVEYLDEIEEAREDDSPPSDEPIEKYEGGVGDDKGYWMRIFGEEEPQE
jgi:hypothetical protein